MRETIIEAEWEEIKDVKPIDAQFNRKPRNCILQLLAFVSGAFWGAFVLSKALELIFY